MGGVFAEETQQLGFIPFPQLQLVFADVEAKANSQVHIFIFELNKLNGTY